jgi:hypothetical protein
MPIFLKLTKPLKRLKRLEFKKKAARIEKKHYSA